MTMLYNPAELQATYNWALGEADVSALVDFAKRAVSTPLIAVGSGGSLTVAAYAAMLHQLQGSVSKAITPLDMLSMAASIQNTSVIFPTAGGKNLDVMTACNFVAQHLPKNVLAMCGCLASPLAQLTHLHGFNPACEFEIKTGSDGFLATVSLLAFCALLLKGYQQAFNAQWRIPSAPAFFESIEQNAAPSSEFLAKQTWIILYGPYSASVAWDAESKLTESTILSSRIIDYRNFSHGHYHWLANHPSTTGVLALITPEEKEVADITLSQLPSSATVHKLISPLKGPVGTLALMTGFIHLIDQLTKARGWNAEKLTPADFGKKLQANAYSFNV